MNLAPTKRLILLALAALISLTGAEAATRYVDASSSSGTGSSWANAFPTLQDALAVAVSGDEIWVARGVYFPDEGSGQTNNDRTSSFGLVNNVDIHGGFGGWETSLSQRQPEVFVTVLSGDIDGNDSDPDGDGILATPADIVGGNAYHVVSGSVASARLSGVTITAGDADGPGTTDPVGGGLWISDGAPEFSELRVIGNRATEVGGGAYLGGPPITPRPSPSFVRCTFAANTGGEAGGGATSVFAEPTFYCCAFFGNSADEGGALALGQSPTEITFCTLAGNSATISGGAIATGFAASVITITNTIAWGNRAAGSSSTADASIAFNMGSTAIYSHSILQNIDLSATGANNLDGTNPANDPAFELAPDPAGAPGTAGDLRLARTSPLLDIGDSNAIGFGQDLIGADRKNDGDGDGSPVTDLGAYELGSLIFVDDTASGTGDGSSWANAFTDLTDALASITLGDEIRVAAGVYYPDSGTVATDGNRFQTFQLSDAVAIIGGYEDGGSATRDPQRNLTILSGDIDQDDDSDLKITRSTGAIVGGNSHHVLRSTAGTRNTAVLDGFTITGGSADWATTGVHQTGGAFWLEGAPTIRNCHFIGNFATDEGGAIHMSCSGAVLEGCKFTANFAGDDGGAVYIDDSSPRIIRCDFVKNSSQDDGGAMVTHESTPLITDSCFRENTAILSGDGAAGGAIFNRGSDLMVKRCSFTGNRAESYQGGAVFSRSSGGVSKPRFYDCQFSGNLADEGGAMFFILSADPTFTNCTFTGNHALSTGGAIRTSTDIYLINCLIWNNREAGSTTSITASVSGTTGSAFENCLVANSGGSASWNSSIGSDEGGNIDTDPLFLEPIDPADAPTRYGDFRLMPGSPAIKAGDNSANPNALDLAGAPRIYNSGIDLGALETGDIIHVDIDNSGSANNGTSWPNAFYDLQNALDIATPGDLILVAEGLHRPDWGTTQIDNDPNSTYQLVDTTAVLGGYPSGGGVRDPAVNLTILSADIDKNDTTDANDIVVNAADIVGLNATHLVTSTGTGKFTRLDGLTLCGGSAGGPNPTPASSGGGLYNGEGSATIANCRFLGNECNYRGAAIYEGGSLTVIDCSFSGNDAGQHGGAMYAFTNTQPTMLRCSMRNNFGSIGSGAVHTHFHCTGHFSNCEFVGNQSARGGGFDNDSGSPTLVNCTFTGNHASIYGGALINWDGPSSTLTNCVLWNNRSGSTTTSIEASARTNASSDPITFINCLVANSGGSAGWDPTMGTDGGDNLDTDPFFLDPSDPTTTPNEIGDPRLATGSPAVGVGLNSASDTPIDLAGNSRVQNSTIDLGAYEGSTTGPDTDKDGLPNYWEKSHTGNLSATDLDPASDLDGDDLNALQEFFHGLDPTVTNAPDEHLNSGTYNNGSSDFLTLTFLQNPAATPFLDFNIERSIDLGLADPWDSADTTFQSSNGNWITYRSMFPRPQLREFMQLKIEVK